VNGNGPSSLPKSERSRSWSELAVPTESFRDLGLPDTAGKDEVKVAYRELAHKYHPDKGGNVALFRQATEAKNRCMAYLENR
jgi:DnaJ-class molecular chaperone